MEYESENELFISQFNMEYVNGLHLFSFSITLQSFIKCLQVFQCLSSKSSKLSRGDRQTGQEMQYKAVGALKT